MVKYDSTKIDDSYSSRNDRYANDNHRRHAKHSIRNDVFTKEELEIIQNVIDKSRNPEPVVSKKTNSSKSKVKSKNKRTDEYGGSPENRRRILQEIVSSIRREVDKNFIIS